MLQQRRESRRRRRSPRAGDRSCYTRAKARRSGGDGRMTTCGREYAFLYSTRQAGFLSARSVNSLGAINSLGCDRMNLLRHACTIALAALATAGPTFAQQLTTGGQPAQLEVRAAGDRAVRISLRPISVGDTVFATPALVDRRYPAPALSIRSLTRPVQAKVGNMRVDVRAAPLAVSVTNAAGQIVQHIVFENDGTLSFALDDRTVLGMGEGGPRPEQGKPWRQQPIQFDRRGRLDTMEPRWQSDAYGSRNPVAMLVGTKGWGLYVPTPWGQVDLRDASRGVLLPWKPTDRDAAPQNERNQQQVAGKGLPPVAEVIPGVFDV